jgi:hypothetical protein
MEEKEKLVKRRGTFERLSFFIWAVVWNRWGMFRAFFVAYLDVGLRERVTGNVVDVTRLKADIPIVNEPRRQRRTSKTKRNEFSTSPCGSS